MSHIVRTCRAVSEDVEPSSLPAIPKGTYGIAGEDDGQDYQPIDARLKAPPRNKR